MTKNAFKKSVAQGPESALDVKIQEFSDKFAELGWFGVIEPFQRMIQENGDLKTDKQKLELLEYLEIYYKHKESHPKLGDLKLVMDVQKAVSEATTDSMTGIANRRAFEKKFQIEQSIISRFNSEKGRNRPYESAIISFDVNGLKRVNDELGHNAGDEFIKHFANVVSSSIRPTEQLFRVGGDEFLMIASGTDKGECDVIISRIREELGEALFLYHGVEISMKTSAGVALIDESSNQLEVLELADQEMYKDKKDQPKSSWVTKGSAPAGNDVLSFPMR